MKLTLAANLFSELGHPVRLAIIRELVKAGHDGINTGELGKRLTIPNSTLTHHVKKLETCGLIKRNQVAQRLVCFCNLDLIQKLSSYLIQACCLESTNPNC